MNVARFTLKKRKNILQTLTMKKNATIRTNGS